MSKGYPWVDLENSITTTEQCMCLIGFTQIWVAPKKYQELQKVLLTIDWQSILGPLAQVIDY